MSPQRIAKRMDISIRQVYDLITEGYFRGGCYYPNGPGRRPVRVRESFVENHIKAFTR